MESVEQLRPGIVKPSGMKDETECPRSHSDTEEYPCHVCGADI